MAACAAARPAPPASATEEIVTVADVGARNEMTSPQALTSERIAALQAGTLQDPFALLGPHRVNGTTTVRTYAPGAEEVHVLFQGQEWPMVELATGVFIREQTAEQQLGPANYLLRIRWPDTDQETEDPY